MKAKIETILFAPSFSPSEVAKLTGVNTVVQRDWRRRGILPKSSHGGAEWTRFHVFPILVMWVSRLLSDRGISLKEGVEFSARAGIHAFWHALMMKRCYAGDHEATFKWMGDDTLKKMARPQIDGPEMLEAWKRVAQVYNLPEDPTKLSPADGLWCQQAEFLARRVFEAFQLKQAIATKPGSLYLPPRYLVWRPDDTQVAANSLDASFHGFLAENVAGASIVIDLYALASAFLDRAGKPLIEVHYRLRLEDEVPALMRKQPVSSIIANAELIARDFANANQGEWA